MNGRHDGVAELELMISERSSVLPHVLRIIVDSNIEVCDCRLGELPLEEIFVHALKDDVGTGDN